MLLKWTGFVTLSLLLSFQIYSNEELTFEDLIAINSEVEGIGEEREALWKREAELRELDQFLARNPNSGEYSYKESVMSREALVAFGEVSRKAYDSEVRKFLLRYGAREYANYFLNNPAFSLYFINGWIKNVVQIRTLAATATIDRKSQAFQELSNGEKVSAAKDVLKALGFTDREMTSTLNLMSEEGSEGIKAKVEQSARGIEERIVSSLDEVRERMVIAKKYFFKLESQERDSVSRVYEVVFQEYDRVIKSLSFSELWYLPTINRPILSKEEIVERSLLWDVEDLKTESQQRVLKKRTCLDSPGS